MNTIEISAIAKDILSEFHYSSFTDAGLSVLYLSSLAKVSEFKAEDMQYEQKYGAPFSSFKERIQSMRGAENFEEEDDLMAWQFAHESRLHWEEKVKELERCF
jgi:hypothetical protein